MRVRVERHVFNSGSQAGEVAQPDLAGHFGVRIGTEEVVLAVEARVRANEGMLPLHFLVKHDEAATPAWAPANMYEVVDPSLPPNWVAHLNPDLELVLAPAAWLEPGFWHAFHSLTGEAGRRATEVFERERATILRADAEKRAGA